MRFQILIESLSSIKKNSLDFLMQQSSLAVLGCGSVRILFSVSQREIKNSFIFKTLFTNLVPSIASCSSNALSNIASVSLTFE